MTDGSGKFEFVDGQWQPTGGGGGSAPGQSAGAMGQGYDRFGADANGNIGLGSSGPVAGQGGRDANGLPTYYQNVTGDTPGSGMGPQSINNPRFNQFLTGESTNTLSDFLKSLGFNNSITDSNFSGGTAPSSPQHNININGNLMNAGLIQQRLNNNKNPDGSFNIDFFKKQMQDEINSLGDGGSQQTPFADGQTYGMGGKVGRTDNGITYNNGANAGFGVASGTGPGGAFGFGAPAGTPSGGPSGQSWTPGSNGSGGPSMGGGGQGGTGGGFGQYGSMGGGNMAQAALRRPALPGGYGGFQGGMQNSAWFPQSEPMMRNGLQRNFQQGGGGQQPWQGVGQQFGSSGQQGWGMIPSPAGNQKFQSESISMQPGDSGGINGNLDMGKPLGS